MAERLVIQYDFVPNQVRLVDRCLLLEYFYAEVALQRQLSSSSWYLPHKARHLLVEVKAPAVFQVGLLDRRFFLRLPQPLQAGGNHCWLPVSRQLVKVKLALTHCQDFVCTQQVMLSSQQLAFRHTLQGQCFEQPVLLLEAGPSEHVESLGDPQNVLLLVPGVVFWTVLRFQD